MPAIHHVNVQRHESRAGATYARFIDDLTADTGWSRDDADRYARAVVATLEERLVGGEASDLAAQLPARLRERLDIEDVGRPDPAMTTDEFLGRVAARTDALVDEVDAIVACVFRTLRAHVTPGQARHVEVQLPDELRRLWNGPSFGRR